MKKAVLLAAWGAGNCRARQSLAQFESLCRERFGLPIRWAYTSQILRERLARERQKSDSVYKALARLSFEGCREVAIQPLQTIPGREYEEVLMAARRVRAETGMACRVGAPLLSANPDLVAAILAGNLPAGREPGECVIFMGHGGRHAGVAMYGALGKATGAIDPNVFIGVMSGALELERILPRLNSWRVWLLPLLSTVGQHTLRDMAGPEPESWKSRIERAGHECRPVLAGMVETEGLANIWLDHLGKAIEKLGEQPALTRKNFIGGNQ